MSLFVRQNKLFVLLSGILFVSIYLLISHCYYCLVKHFGMGLVFLVFIIIIVANTGVYVFVVMLLYVSTCASHFIMTV